MSNENIPQRITDILVDQLGVKPEEVTPSANIYNDLGADSLDTIELVMAIEEEFDFEISDEDAQKLATPQAMIDHVTKALA